MKKANTRWYNTLSIRWKLFFYLTCLMLTILFLMWVFQIFMLDNFYEMTRRRELRWSAAVLSKQLDSPEVLEVASDLAVEGAMRVVVYRTTETGITMLADVDATSGSSLYPHQDKIVEMVELARENDGMYIGKVTIPGMAVKESMFDFWFSSEDLEYERIQTENTRLICVNIVENSAGDSCTIIFDAELFPLNSTVHMLEMQFIWIAVIVLLVALLCGYYLFRRICKPLIRMNESAKQLAKGNHDVKFTGEGYLESHELADTLNYAVTEISRADHLQKELLANISHDLRTPLTMIKGYGELMRDIPGENTPENMQVVIDETERLSELVSDLLDLSQLQSGNAPFCMEPLDLTLVVRECMVHYDALVHHRGYHIEFLAEQSVWVMADRKMLLQVLYNLINNAINYTGADRLVKVEQTVQDGRVRITVTDRGDGIAPEELPLIWDRYYKVDKIHKRAMVGTGLGLSIVKGILERHGALYGVSSEIGQGASFWFELPIIPETSDEIQQLED